MAEPQPNAPPSPPPSNGQSPEVKIPDKFLKDGKPDLNAFVTSYGELETKYLSKTQDLRKQIEADLYKERPEAADKYAIPEIDGVDKDELTNHPMLGWWREQAFTGGLSQGKFEEGIKKYLDVMAPAAVPEEVLTRELGDGYKTRIAAVDTWAQKTAKSDGEMAAFRQIATSPDGIKLMERLAGLAGNMEGDTPVPKQETLTIDKLRSMQQDPKYWDPAVRDPDFIRQVEDGYAKLYPAKRA